MILFWLPMLFHRYYFQIWGRQRKAVCAIWTIEWALSNKLYSSVLMKPDSTNLKLIGILGKREKSLIFEQEKFCADKIAQLEESLKKKKQVIKKWKSSSLNLLSFFFFSTWRAVNFHFTLCNAGWQNFQHFEENSLLFSGQWLGWRLPTWRLKICFNRQIQQDLTEIILFILWNV